MFRRMPAPEAYGRSACRKVYRIIPPLRGCRCSRFWQWNNQNSVSAVQHHGHGVAARVAEPKILELTRALTFLIIGLNFYDENPAFRQSTKFFGARGIGAFVNHSGVVPSPLSSIWRFHSSGQLQIHKELFQAAREPVCAVLSAFRAYRASSIPSRSASTHAPELWASSFSRIAIAASASAINRSADDRFCPKIAARYRDCHRLSH